MSTIVSVRDLTKHIGKRRVLDGLSFEIEEGHVVGLLGPNGAGKTTLMKVLMNIWHADTGEVRICGEAAGFAANEHISYMPDSNHLFPWMRVRDAIHYYRDMFGDFDIDRSKELCSLLGINEHDKVKSLSKGMTQRVLVMLTFSRNAQLFLLDEPIGGIDPLTRGKIVKAIFTGSNRGGTMIVATHQVAEVETLLDDVLFIDNGKLIHSDNADNIRESRGMSIEECYMEVFENA